MAGRVICQLFITWLLLNFKQKCSATTIPNDTYISTSGSGNILSHTGYGTTDYPNSLNSRWFIKTGPEKKILLYFIDFYLEENSLCDFDSMYIHKVTTTGTKLITKMCGIADGKVLDTEAREIILNLKTDEQTPKRGFNISYEVVNKSVNVNTYSNTSCWGSEILSNQSGTINSHVNYRHPFSPAYNYNNSMLCHWYIETDPSNVFIMNFDQMRLEENPYCSWDKVTIFDDVKGGYLVPIYEVCGTYAEQNRISLTNKVKVEFRTDKSQTSSGFSLNYTPMSATAAPPTVSPGPPPDPTVVTPPSVVLSHTGFGTSNYSNYIISRWTVKTNSGNKILLQIVNFDTEYNSNCTNDYLYLLKVTTTGSEVMTRMCGVVGVKLLDTEAAHLSLIFRTDFSVTKSGFRISCKPIPTTMILFRYSNATCWGSEILSNQSGTIYSHIGFNNSLSLGSKYNNHMYCQWYIQTDTGNVFRLKFLSLNIEESVNCFWDYVSIFDVVNGTELIPISKSCGTSDEVIKTSSTNRVKVEFRTDNGETGYGFALSYSAINPSETTVSSTDSSTDTKSTTYSSPSTLSSSASTSTETTSSSTDSSPETKSTTYSSSSTISPSASTSTETTVSSTVSSSATDSTYSSSSTLSSSPSTSPEKSGGWSTWKGNSSCSKDCGVGVVFLIRKCVNPVPSSSDLWCLKEDGVTKALEEIKNSYCHVKACRLTPEERRYSVLITFISSSPISLQTYLLHLHGVIMNSVTGLVNDYCNANPFECCGKQQGQWKRKTNSTLNFVKPNEIGFGSNTPTINSPNLTITIFVTPNPNNLLCQDFISISVRSRRSATAGTISLKINVLSQAISFIRLGKTVKAINNALSSAGLNITVSLSSSRPAVTNSTGSPGPGTNKPSRVSNLWVLPVVVMILAVICLIAVFIWFVILPKYRPTKYRLHQLEVPNEPTENQNGGGIQLYQTRDQNSVYLSDEQCK